MQTKRCYQIRLVKLHTSPTNCQDHLLCFNNHAASTCRKMESGTIDTVRLKYRLQYYVSSGILHSQVKYV